MTEKRNYIFDFLRVLFTVSVIVTHASGLVFNSGIAIAHVGVEGFFMISGFFMAKHLFSRRFENPAEVFLNYHLGRIKRLFPLAFIVCLLVQLKDIIFAHKISILRWFSIYFIGDINGIPGFPVMWYVSALFWGGLLVSALLVWKRKTSVLVIFPLAFFVLFSFMYNHYNLWLMLKDFLSMGMLRSVCGLIVGVEVFYGSVFLESKLQNLRFGFRKLLAILTELFFIVCFVTLFPKWFTMKYFLVYLFVPMILLVISLNEQVIFRLFDRRCFAHLGKVTYAVYLTHLYLIMFVAKFDCIRKMNQFLGFFLIVIASFLLGTVFDFLCRKIVRFFRFISCN
ncbi:acyltransferase family protein [Treponema zioleckii]|uniref:acyltransferase family protein n=1 Tax=Treponema zioleckii TaxID=331680 RepID=UPI00168B3473|nr:acyltransferase family protein [Treponema zioleckii]